MRGGKVDFRNTFFKMMERVKKKCPNQFIKTQIFSVEQRMDSFQHSFHCIIWDKTNGQITYFCASNLQKGQIFARDM